MSEIPNPGANPAHDTPIMRQYTAAKARYPKHLLFFRVGDFYELFFEDAKTISRALGLTLTARNKGPDPIPMAGVPVHSAEPYVARLLRQGFSVAVCDQMEEQAAAKGLVKREVTRVVTPGTVLEENLLEARKPNRIAALLPSPAQTFDPLGDGAQQIFGLAVADLASGSFYVQELKGVSALRSEFARLSPSELLAPENPVDAKHRGLKQLPALPLEGVAVSFLKAEAFAFSEAHTRIVQRFSDNSTDKTQSARLKKLIKDLPLACAAAGALAGYVDETSPGGKIRLLSPQPFDPDTYMELGEAAIRSLELFETIRTRTFEGSLLYSIDRCCTSAGGRCLREWLIRPLRDLAAIQQRQDAVGALVENVERRADLRNELKKLGDIERIAARLSASRATPRDLVVLKDTLLLLPGIQKLIGRAVENLGILESNDTSGGMSRTLTLLDQLGEKLGGLDPIAATIAARLRDDCPNAINEGGLIRDGVDAELDRLHGIATGGKGWIANFQTSEIKRSGISSLKIGFNRVFGYYIEISHANRANVPADYERRQTLTNAERYTTPELKTREAEVLGAEEKIHALEQRLFLQLREELIAHTPRLHAAGQALAEIDALCSLAEVAHKKGHVRPLLSLNGRVLIEQMRHPVLEDTIPAGELVANDLHLCAGGIPSGPGGAGNGGAQIVILTGPNMAGKSTYIRASALCVILAQMGAFVPADRAEVGIVDRVFTRVGAADDLAGGRSTFMVEMTEVAEILAACTSRSLVVLDEVGRGTSTYDGVSLAWALIEHLHEGTAKPRTLFATHYHELGALEQELPRVKNASASVKEWQGEITFLHRIVPGPSERSFGIHVARLAGLPDSLLKRAKDILLALEEDGVRRPESAAQKPAPKSKNKRPRQDGQMLLFEAPEEVDPALKGLLQTLKGVDAHTMTPVQALALLDELARTARKI